MNQLKHGYHDSNFSFLNFIESIWLTSGQSVIRTDSDLGSLINKNK